MEFWKKLSEALRQKGFSALEIKELQDTFGDLDSAELLRLSPDRLLAAMTGRTVADGRAKADTVLRIIGDLTQSNAATEHKRVVTLSGRVTNLPSNIDWQQLSIILVTADQRSGQTALRSPLNTDGTFILQTTADEWRHMGLSAPAELFLQVAWNGRPLYTGREPLRVSLDTAAQPVEIALPAKALSRLEAASAPQALRKELDLRAIAEAAQLSTETLERLRQANIATLDDLFSTEARDSLTAADLSPAESRALYAAGRWAALSGDVALSARLIDHGFDSLNRLASVTPGQAEARLTRDGKPLSSEERAALKDLIGKARVGAHLVKDAIIARGTNTRIHPDRHGSMIWKDVIPGIFQPIIEPAPNDEPLCADCDACATVFSPLAYIYDLVSFIGSTWFIEPQEIERLILQPIDLDCSAAQAPIRQILLACEVLEQHLTGELAGPLSSSAAWRNHYQEHAQAVLKLLGLAPTSSAPPPAHQPLYQAANSTNPTLKELLALNKEAHAVFESTLEAAVALLGPPPDNDDAYAAYLAAQMQLEAEQEQQRRRFDKQIEGLTAPLFSAYREQLIAASNNDAATLEQHLFIDLHTAPCQMTTRGIQIIQSLQSFILSVRTRALAGNPRPAAQAIDIDRFAPEPWHWLQSYASWNAAMYVLLYPENLLSPPIQRRRMTNLFQRAIERLVAGSASLQVVSELERDYEELFRSIDQLEAVTSHVIGSELFIFARNEVIAADSTRTYRLWLNRLSTSSLSTPPVAVNPVTPDAGGWTEVLGWPEELIPHVVLPYGRGDGLMFIGLGYKGNNSEAFDSWRTLRLAPQGRVTGEASIEGTLPNAPGSNPKSEFWNLSTSNSLSHEPTLWARTFTTQGNNTTLHYFYARLDSDSGTWTAWQYHGDPYAAGGNLTPWFNWLGSTIVNRSPCSAWRKDALTAGIRSWPFPAEAAPQDAVLELDKPLSSPAGGSVSLAWNRDGNESYLILSEPNGAIQVKRVSVRNNGLDLDFQMRVTVVLKHIATAERWPIGTAFNQLDPASPAARHIAVTERYLYFPLLAGWALNRSGNFASAYQMYRRLYDLFAQPQQVFPFTDVFTGGFERPDDWLHGIEDPDAVAKRRAGPYLRHAILMQTKNLLDWADHQFTLNNAESRNRARELYQLAAQVLQAPAFANPCAEQLQALEFAVAREVGGLRATTAEAAAQHKARAQLIQRAIAQLMGIPLLNIVREATEHIKALQARSLSLRQLALELETIVASALLKAREQQALPATLLGRRKEEQALHDQLEQILDPHWQKNIGPPTPSSAAPPSNATAVFCIPPNPLLQAYQMRIDVALTLLRNCLDINGEPGQPQLTGSLEGRIIDTFGQLQNSLNSGPITPPRYRYDFLIEKSRQHTGLAQQLQTLMLAAIEKRDSAALALLQAEIAEEVAAATITLRALGRDEAVRGVQIANLQLERALVELGFWEDRVGDGMNMMGAGGLNEAEMTAMALMASSGAFQGLSALTYFMIAAPAAGVAFTGAAAGIGATAAGLVQAASVAGLPTLPVNAAVGIAGIAAIGAGLIAGGQQMASGFSATAGALGTFGSLALTFASFERRWEDWQHQHELAGIGRRLADAHLGQAQLRVTITAQEQAVAELQHNHTRLVIDFLKNQFSNEQLYQWMIGVLQDSYRSVMQHAVTTARLAQHALEFERQQPITVIQGDYWSIDEATLSEAQRASGLLGAERLLADMSKLDEWKIRTDRRRLELSKTISLAQALPSALMHLRESGAITFNTLQEWFDWDFPGHYMRLVKSVKVTVIALVPPVDGIHATLSNSGFSRVVVNNSGSFVEVDALQRFPETVALDSPINDSGVFVLNYNDPMLLPFEGLGVETLWRFELPHASNRLNFDSLVDVLFTIEYTAYQDAAYRGQVIARLGERKSSDVVISLRHSYPDQWYDLHNPADPTTAQTIPFALAAHTFPPPAGAPLGLQHLMVLLVGPAGKERSGDLALRKVGMLPELPITTDDHGAYSSRIGAGVDGTGTPRTRFAVDQANAGLLLPPTNLDGAQLLDPRGEWQFTFAPTWYAAINGARIIDDLADIILIPTVVFEVSCPN
ncbi:Tc toxin subunit A-related protein [Desulfonatronum parangueonense]